MKKKVLVLVMAACLAASMVGCSKAKDKAADNTMTSQENKDMNADMSDMADGDENKDADADKMDKMEDVVTEGTFKAQELSSDVTKATFTGADGNDFVAIISATTEMPEGDLVEGKKYKVHHDNMEAMSNPPQYTNVTKIEAAE